MIVCNCRAASERDVDAAIQRGAESLSDLKRCGIGDDCGSCHNALREMITAANCGGASRRFWSALAESGSSALPHPETQW